MYNLYFALLLYFRPEAVGWGRFTTSSFEFPDLGVACTRPITLHLAFHVGPSPKQSFFRDRSVLLYVFISGENMWGSEPLNGFPCPLCDGGRSMMLFSRTTCSTCWRNVSQSCIQVNVTGPDAFSVQRSVQEVLYSAPVRPHKYHLPSLTTRKEMPAMFAWKRARSSAPGEVEGAVEPTLSEADTIKTKCLQIPLLHGEVGSRSSSINTSLRMP